jgi:hypothetical protein
MNDMPIQELWEVKEKLSEKFWGKSAEEINAIIRPNAEEMMRKIDELRKNKKKHCNPI